MEKQLVLTEIKDVDLSKLDSNKRYLYLDEVGNERHSYPNQIQAEIDYHHSKIKVSRIYLPPSSNSLQGMIEPDGWLVESYDNELRKPRFDGRLKKDCSDDMIRRLKESANTEAFYFAPFLSQPIEEKQPEKESIVDAYQIAERFDRECGISEEERQALIKIIEEAQPIYFSQLDNKKQVEDWDKVEKEFEEENVPFDLQFLTWRDSFAWLKQSNYSLPIVDIGEKKDLEKAIMGLLVSSNPSGEKFVYFRNELELIAKTIASLNQSK